jgi:hypothetical protein
MCRLRSGLLAFCACAIAACGPSGSPPTSEIASLHFSTSTTIPDNPPPAVEVTLTDAAKARDVYAATLALPYFPPQGSSCPIDYGVRYTVDFSGAAGLVATAVLNPGGCGDVTLTGSSTRRILGTSYWSTLAGDLGVEESAIYPYVKP